ncbi:F-box protein SKIP31 [Linum perenne]
MTTWDDEDELLAQLLESEVLSESSDQDPPDDAKDDDAGIQPKAKRVRIDEGEKIDRKDKGKEKANDENGDRDRWRISRSRRIGSGIFSQVPPELFPQILKFLSSEDLVSCSLVCRFMNCAASDESLWRRLYCMRWGLLPPTNNLSQGPWKTLYIQRDEEDMVNLLRNCQPEFKPYYIQMQAAKRSQAPTPAQVKDDNILLDKTVADQISIWKNRRGLTDSVVVDHNCSGNTCSYYQIGDVFVCEKTGNVHGRMLLCFMFKVVYFVSLSLILKYAYSSVSVCDETCRENITDPSNELMVCTISGRCSDILLPTEVEPEPDQQQYAGTEEAEPFMGSGRFARAYMLGYNCDNEQELQDALRFC